MKRYGQYKLFRKYADFYVLQNFEKTKKNIVAKSTSAGFQKHGISISAKIKKRKKSLLTKIRVYTLKTADL